MSQKATWSLLSQWMRYGVPIHVSCIDFSIRAGVRGLASCVITAIEAVYVTHFDGRSHTRYRLGGIFL